MKINILYFTILFSLFLNSSHLKAAPNSGTLLNFENELRKFNKLPKVIPDESNFINGEPVQNGEKLLVRGFRLVGKKNGISDEEILETLKEQINKELTFSEIQLIAKKVQDFFRNKGYFLAQAFIPEQEVKDGIIEIFITEGKLDGKEPFELKKNNLRLKDNLPISYFIEGLDGRLTIQNLERSILNLNDVPGIKAKVSLKKGDDPYSSRVVIEAEEGPILTGSINMDNYGNRYTGQNRLTGTLYVNNPSQAGDQIIYRKTYSTSKNFDLNSVSYNFPLGRDGLRANISVNDLNYNIAKELKTEPMSQGDAQTFAINFNYPIERTAKRALFISQDINKKYLYNETTGVVSSDKNIESYKTNMSIQYIDDFLSGGYTQFSIDQSFGTLDLSGSASDLNTDQSSTGAKTNGNYAKTFVQFYRLQRIVDKLDLQVLGAAQISNKNLDSSEKFILGGVSGVRAYPSGEASGDEGKKISYDLKYDASDYSFFSKTDMFISVFYDYGTIQQYNDLLNINLTTPNKYSLKGWGASLDLLSGQKYGLKLGWADSLSGNPGKTSSGNNSDGKDNTSRYWFLGSIKLK